MRRGIVGERALTEGQKRDTPPIGEEAERANADQAARQDVGWFNFRLDCYPGANHPSVLAACECVRSTWRNRRRHFRS